MSGFDVLTDDDKRSLLILLMEDIRGAFDGGSFDRTHAVIDLAQSLGYTQIEQRARTYLNSEWDHDGRYFRTTWPLGYGDPPFPVTRSRAEASEALVTAVEGTCEYPEYRLTDEVV